MSSDLRSLTKTYLIASVLALLAVASPSTAQMEMPRPGDGPMPDEIRSAVAQRATKEAKLAYLVDVFDRCKIPAVRSMVLTMMEQAHMAGIEAPLIHAIRRDPDPGVRIDAALMLAKYGTARSIEPLLVCAEKDRSAFFLRGWMGGTGNARFNAYLALTEIGVRSPTESKRIAEAVRRLPPVETDSEDVARTTLLYKLAADRTVLLPLLEKLRSKDPKVRVKGITIFRFVKMRPVPKEVSDRLFDTDGDVRAWTAQALGQMGDPATIPLLMRAARDKRLGVNARNSSIYALGSMRVTKAVALLNRIITEKDPTLTSTAAIAVSRITGRRHPLVPSWYRLD
jgi:hypothetical protein